MQYCEETKLLILLFHYHIPRICQGMYVIFMDLAGSRAAVKIIYHENFALALLCT